MWRMMHAGAELRVIMDVQDMPLEIATLGALLLLCL